MMDSDSENALKIGRAVRILRGRDAEKVAIIIRHDDDERFVWIADGDKRKFDSAKRKNVRHIRPLPFHSPEVANSIAETKRVTNGKLRFAVNKCNETLQFQSEKGE